MSGMDIRRLISAACFQNAISVVGFFAASLVITATSFGQQLTESRDPYYNPSAARGGAPTELPPERDTSGGGQFQPLAQTSGQADTRSFRPPADRPGGNNQDSGKPTGNPAANNDHMAMSFAQAANPADSQGSLIGESFTARGPVSSVPGAESARPGQNFEPGRVLARVGGQPIFVADLSMEARQIIEQFIPNAPDSVKQSEIPKILPKLLPSTFRTRCCMLM